MNKRANSACKLLIFEEVNNILCISSIGIVFYINNCVTLLFINADDDVSSTIVQVVCHADNVMQHVTFLFVPLLLKIPITAFLLQGN